MGVTQPTFGIPIIPPERLMLENSNLSQRWMAVSTNAKYAKLGQMGSWWRHVTQVWNFGSPNTWETIEA